MISLLISLFMLTVIVATFWWGQHRRSPDDVTADEGTSMPDERLRWPITILLLGGFSLVLLSQAVVMKRQPHVPAAIYVILVLGLMAFLVAGESAVRGSNRWLSSKRVTTVADFFGIVPGQLLLLLLAFPLAYLARHAAGNGTQAMDPIVATVAWVLAITSVVAGSLRRQLPKKIEVGFDELLGVAILFLMAFLMRAINLDTIPTTLSGDEASAGLVAVEYWKGKANNLLGLGWFSFPSFYFAVQSIGLYLFGQTTTALRITSALAGALTVTALYWLGRTLYGRLAGILAALYLFGSHFHVHFSRIGLQNIWDGFFLVGVLLGLWHGWKTGRRASFVLCGLLLGLAQYFYISSRILPLLLLIWAAVAFIGQRERFKQRFADLVLAAFVAFVVVLPLALLFLEQPNEFSAPMNRVSVFNGWLEAEVELTGEPAGRIILKQMAHTALGFAHRPLRHWYNPGEPLLLPAAGALFLMGLFWLLYDFNLQGLLLLLPIAGLILIGGLSQDAPASQRFVVVAPIVSLVLAVPVHNIVQWLRTIWPRFRLHLEALAVFVTCLITLGDVHYYYFDVYDKYVLGGYNTETATGVAYYLREQPDASQVVYFFGIPRMGYFSLSTIPYLAPEMEGKDVAEPLTAPPTWSLEGPTLFIFLPERKDEMRHVQAAYPGGRVRAVASPLDKDEVPLFFAYEVAGP